MTPEQKQHYNEKAKARMAKKRAVEKRSSKKKITGIERKRLREKWKAQKRNKRLIETPEGQKEKEKRKLSASLKKTHA